MQLSPAVYQCCRADCVLSPLPSSHRPTVDRVRTHRSAARWVWSDLHSCWQHNHSHLGTPPHASGSRPHTCSSTDVTGRRTQSETNGSHTLTRTGMYALTQRQASRHSNTNTHTFMSMYGHNNKNMFKHIHAHVWCSSMHS